MKLNCKTEVVLRISPITKTNKTTSVLALTKHGDSLYLYLFNTSNRNGKKYTLKKNIEQIFTKFLNDGKSTIRFIQPPEDLMIQAETLPLKHFLQIIRMGLENGPIRDLTSGIGVTVKSKDIAQRTKLKISRRSEYPFQGFPRTLTCLRVNGLRLMSFDKGILNLQRLHTLDLSNNIISSVPADLGKIPNLTSLNLANNRLGGCRDWRWIGNNLRTTLIELDLSANNLKYCPINIHCLEKLVSLNISANQLTTLPNSICVMRNLKILNVSHNVLKYVPSGMALNKLDSIDLSNNAYITSDEFTPLSNSLTLLNLAATAVLYYRVAYLPEMLPFTLQQYLMTPAYCVCGRPIFVKQFRQIIPFYRQYVCAKNIINDARLPTIEGIFCSEQCLPSSEA